MEDENTPKLILNTLENSIRHWNHIQSQSWKVISQIQNIAAKLVHLKKGSLGKLKNFENIGENIGQKLAKNLEEAIIKLKKSLPRFKTIVKEFKELEKELGEFEASILSMLEKSNRIGEEFIKIYNGTVKHFLTNGEIFKECVEFCQLIIEFINDTEEHFNVSKLIDELSIHVREIVQMYENELLVKETICNDISAPLPPISVLTTYLWIIWMTEPYIETGRIEEIKEEMRDISEKVSRLSIKTT
ncbi:MAG: hypothetical protein ACFFA5_00735 [Promethearchaeota archaeon]